jgi:hypothetical protein
VVGDLIMIYATSLKEIEVIARWRGINSFTLKRVQGVWILTGAK